MRLSVKGGAIDLLYPAQWKSIWLRVNETEMKILLNLRRFFCGKMIYITTRVAINIQESRHKNGEKGENLIHGWLLYAPDDSIDLIYAADEPPEKHFLQRAGN